MATMATTGLREPDSVKLLSDQVRAFRAKVIAYLMTPKPNGEGYDLDQVVEDFKGSMEDVCEDFWDEGVRSSHVCGFTPSTILGVYCRG